jgi:hypothetical protein
MVTRLVSGAFVAGVAFAALGPVDAGVIAHADPPFGETDVPQMQYDAVLGAPCFNFGRYIFGRSPNGQALACVEFDGQGTWVLSSPLRGVQEVGEECPQGVDAAAQTPDGRALMCVYGQGWQPGP